MIDGTQLIDLGGEVELTVVGRGERRAGRREPSPCASCAIARPSRFGRPVSRPAPLPVWCTRTDSSPPGSSTGGDVVGGVRGRAGVGVERVGKDADRLTGPVDAVVATRRRDVHEAVAFGDDRRAHVGRVAPAAGAERGRGPDRSPGRAPRSRTPRRCRRRSPATRSARPLAVTVE